MLLGTSYGMAAAAARVLKQSACIRGPKESREVPGDPGKHVNLIQRAGVLRPEAGRLLWTLKRGRVRPRPKK